MSTKRTINGYPFIKYEGEQYDTSEIIYKSGQFFEWINQRRSVRDFSSKPVPREVIINILKSANCAPSGANKQPWSYCVVESKDIKAKIREAAEKEEQKNYGGRMGADWLRDLEHLGTNEKKLFLETAPYLIIIFKRIYELEGDRKRNNYYVNESVGLSAGFLLTAIHNAGLVALTHTPSPMNFLTKILKRPKNEKPFLLIPVGYASSEAYVPDICRKSMEEFIDFY